MKKTIALLLVLILAFTFVGCNDPEAEAEIRENLVDHRWVHYGAESSETISFLSNGTYGEIIMQGGWPITIEGTYSINTRDKTVSLKQKSGQVFKYSYSEFSLSSLSGSYARFERENK